MLVMPPEINAKPAHIPTVRPPNAGFLIRMKDTMIPNMLKNISAPQPASPLFFKSEVAAYNYLLITKLSFRRYFFILLYRYFYTVIQPFCLPFSKITTKELNYF